MNINNKFNIGNKVYIVSMISHAQYCVKELRIIAVRLFKTKTEENISYDLTSGYNRCDEEVFKTKKECTAYAEEKVARSKKDTIESAKKSINYYIDQIQILERITNDNS